MKTTPLLLLAAIPILAAAPPPRVTNAELERFESLVKVNKTPDLGAVEGYEKAQALSKASTKRMADFLNAISQAAPALISQLDAPTPAEDEEENPLEGLFKPDPDSLIITCSEGIYLDGEKYKIDYMGQVKIQGKGLTMTCDQQLKVLFYPPEKKEEEKKPEAPKEKQDPLAKFGGFGDLKQFIASGNVRVNGQTEDGQKVYMGGDNALYEMSKNGELENSTITFRGKKLGFMRGDVDDKESDETAYAMTSISDDAWIKAVLRGQKLFVEWSPTGWLTKVRPSKKNDKKK
jgi:hypothetical protein